MPSVERYTTVRTEASVEGQGPVPSARAGRCPTCGGSGKEVVVIG